MSYFKTTYQEFIYKRTYARWIDELGRREEWQETVGRYAKFFEPKVPEQFKDKFYSSIELLQSLEVLPSMRCLWTAGEALEREHIAGYNCAYTPIDSVRSFAEILYILMNGTGVGFSVERQYINQLPEIPREFRDAHRTVVFGDSKLGWAQGFLDLLENLYEGVVPTLDFSLIRPKGARLKTFGGRASGPEPLKQLCKYTIDVFDKSKGRKLNSLECYDIVCMVAGCVVVGGVRRSATINLSNFSDQRMKHAKDGQFWIDNPQRWLSNNSVAYTEKPDAISFLDEWLNLARSGSGERGIINRACLQKTRGQDIDYGVNPCGEIILRPKQFCNLTEVVVRADDTYESLKPKVEAATILGILQSTLTNFSFISDTWKKNCEEERLLGVSLTGLADNRKITGVLLHSLKLHTRAVANEWADALGINRPAAITCVKPSGTVSQLVNSSSGLHPRYSAFYIRRVRVTATDPLANFLKEKGVPWNPEVGETPETHNTCVFDFPIKSPQGAITKNELSAIAQLEYWLMLKEAWCDHNPSCTIYIRDDEWLKVGAWVYEHWDSIGGLSFLPVEGGTQPLQPYEEISQEQYTMLTQAFPNFTFSELTAFEKQDMTQGSREFACTGGSCEL